jgi:hypothetical protein
MGFFEENITSLRKQVEKSAILYVKAFNPISALLLSFGEII